MPLFESPVGGLGDRNAGEVWPTNWHDANRYGNLYDVKTGRQAYHTGADLNCDGDLDAHAPVYAIGDGKVTFADLYSERSWGNLVIINHGVVDGKLLFSRYAHVERIAMAILKKPGTVVRKGDQIARVGNGGAVLNFPYHLHFDLSTTAILNSQPGYWPGLDEKGVHVNFVNPLDWLQASHVLGNPAGKKQSTSTQNIVSTPIPSDCEEQFVIHDGVQVMKSPGLSAQVVQVLKPGTKLTIKKDGQGNQDNLTWAQIGDGEFNGCWVALCKDDQSEFYLSKQPQ